MWYSNLKISYCFFLSSPQEVVNKNTKRGTAMPRLVFGGPEKTLVYKM